MSETSTQVSNGGRLSTTSQLKPSLTSLTPTPTERFTPDQITPLIRFPLFPLGTIMVGPVVIIQAMKPRPVVLLSNKLIFPDGTQVVVGVETRALWQGADGAAFDANPATRWRIAASVRNGIIVNQGNIR